MVQWSQTRSGPSVSKHLPQLAAKGVIPKMLSQCWTRRSSDRGAHGSRDAGREWVRLIWYPKFSKQEVLKKMSIWGEEQQGAKAQAVKTPWGQGGCEGGITAREEKVVSKKMTGQARRRWLGDLSPSITGEVSRPQSERTMAKHSWFPHRSQVDARCKGLHPLCCRAPKHAWAQPHLAVLGLKLKVLF